MSSVNALLENLIRPAKLLLVEDDERVGEAFSYWLNAKYVCHLVWAKTGEEAVDLVASTRETFDLIFLNLSLPGISGVDVLRQVKQKWPNVPVVLVTGFSNNRMTEEAARLGVVGLFNKPVSGNEFESLFRTYKIKARSREDQRYFDQCRPATFRSQPGCA